jgi:hypothetical protein
MAVMVKMAFSPTELSYRNSACWQIKKPHRSGADRNSIPDCAVRIGRYAVAV